MMTEAELVEAARADFHAAGPAAIRNNLPALLEGLGIAGTRAGRKLIGGIRRALDRQDFDAVMAAVGPAKGVEAPDRDEDIRPR